MSETDRESWKDENSGRERVRYVVEILESPATVQEIADRAEVSWSTANDELERLENDDWVEETTVKDKKAYKLNPVRILFDEISNLISENSRTELETKLTELKERQESLVKEYDADTLSEFRQQLSEKDLSSDELRERQNIIETWETINSEIRLVKHALHMYGDVSNLSSPTTDTETGISEA
ncbi:winged helix-turn-helix domain-containing protein (plasmid) [Halorutilales archaeon Cl-col2-1]